MSYPTAMSGEVRSLRRSGSNWRVDRRVGRRVGKRVGWRVGRRVGRRAAPGSPARSTRHAVLGGPGRTSMPPKRARLLDHSRSVSDVHYALAFPAAADWTVNTSPSPVSGCPDTPSPNSGVGCLNSLTVAAWVPVPPPRPDDGCGFLDDSDGDRQEPIDSHFIF